jgi:hypothetical protein
MAREPPVGVTTDHTVASRPRTATDDSRWLWVHSRRVIVGAGLFLQTGRKAQDPRDVRSVTASFITHAGHALMTAHK